MLRALTAWLAPTSRDAPTAQSCGDDYDHNHDDDRFFSSATRLFTFHHHHNTTQAGVPIPTSAYHNRKRPSLDDGPMPYPAGHESPTAAAATARAAAIRSKSPSSHGRRDCDVTDEELEEAMAQFAEISLPSMPACSMSDDGPHLTDRTDAETMTTKTTMERKKEEVLPPPKCWCRLPTDAKEARMRDNDPLNPSRAYWTCANVGGTCSFFQWVEIIPPSKRTTPSSGSSSSSSSAAVASLLLSASNSAKAAKDNDYLAGSSSAGLSSSLASAASTSIFTSSTPKPYRSSAPIPIPQVAGAAANGRRRTPAKSAQEGADDESSC